MARSGSVRSAAFFSFVFFWAACGGAPTFDAGGHPGSDLPVNPPFALKPCQLDGPLPPNARYRFAGTSSASTQPPLVRVALLTVGFESNEVGRRAVQRMVDMLRLERSSLVGQFGEGLELVWFDGTSVDDLVCLRTPPSGALPTPWLTLNQDLSFGLRSYSPELDAFVVVVRSDEGRSNADLKQRVDDPAHVPTALVGYSTPSVTSELFDHELAHALVGLEDEYGEVDAGAPELWPLASTAERARGYEYLNAVPNVSVSSSSPKFNGAATREGAARRTRGFFASAEQCRMKTTVPPFGSICQGAIKRFIDVREGRARSTPACFLAAEQRSPGQVGFLSYSWSFAGLDSVSLNGDRLDLWGYPGYSSFQVHQIDGGSIQATLDCIDRDGGVANASVAGQ